MSTCGFRQVGGKKGKQKKTKKLSKKTKPTNSVKELLKKAQRAPSMKKSLNAFKKDQSLMKSIQSLRSMLKKNIPSPPPGFLSIQNISTGLLLGSLVKKSKTKKTKKKGKSKDDSKMNSTLQSIHSNRTFKKSVSSLKKDHSLIKNFKKFQTEIAGMYDNRIRSGANIKKGDTCTVLISGRWIIGKVINVLGNDGVEVRYSSGGKFTTKVFQESDIGKPWGKKEPVLWRRSNADVPEGTEGEVVKLDDKNRGNLVIKFPKKLYTLPPEQIMRLDPFHKKEKGEPWWKIKTAKHKRRERRRENMGPGGALLLLGGAGVTAFGSWMNWW